MTYMNINKLVIINELEKDHGMIEARRLKKVVIFIQTVLSFVLSSKIINIYKNIARKYENLQLKIFENMKY